MPEISNTKKAYLEIRTAQAYSELRVLAKRFNKPLPQFDVSEIEGKVLCKESLQIFSEIRWETLIRELTSNSQVLGISPPVSFTQIKRRKSDLGY